MAGDASRRQFLKLSIFTVAAGLASPVIAKAKAFERTITLHHLHTGESLKTVYWANGAYVPENLRQIDRLLRDFRTEDVVPIDPKLVDILHRLSRAIEARRPFVVVSGYRSPKTNSLLRQRSSSVAKHSYHIRGMAVDVQLPGLRLDLLHRAALKLRAGGVGYYPKSGFIHVDTGDVRTWGGGVQPRAGIGGTAETG